jgi:hypothetical protein
MGRHCARTDDGKPDLVLTEDGRDLLEQAQSVGS